MQTIDDPGKVEPRTIGLTVAVGAVAFLTYSVLLGDGHTVFVFAGKEQLFEHLSAWLFLLASLFALGAGLHYRRAGARRGKLLGVAYWSLAVLFFVAFGEELSWGQHYFGFETPEAIQGLNQQQELNLHNLSIFDSNTDSGKKTGLFGKFFNSNRLFDYFMLTLFVAIPWGYRLFPWSRGLLDRLGAPRMTWVLALPLLLNAALSVIAEVWVVHNHFRHMATSEIRELNYAVLCVVGMASLYLFERRAARPAEELPPAPAEVLD